MSNRAALAVYTMAVFAMIVSGAIPTNVPEVMMMISLCCLGIATVTGHQIWKKLKQ